MGMTVICFHNNNEENPATGEQIDIPASKAPAFKAGKAFKDAIQ